jgi:uncharacterized coiled-coil protein SlyX
VHEREDLRLSIPLRDEKIAGAEDEIRELSAKVEAMNDEIRLLTNKVGENRQQIGAMIEERRRSDAEQDNLIHELMGHNKELEARITDRNEDVRVLTSTLDTYGEESGGMVKQWTLTYTRSKTWCYTRCSAPPSVHPEEKAILYMFYNGHDLSSLCAITGLPPNQMFGLLQSLIAPVSSSLPKPSEFPMGWQLNKAEFDIALRNLDFLFSAPLFEALRLCNTVPDLAALLNHALEDLSQRKGRDWQPVALFVMEMVIRSVLFRRI